MRHTVDSQFYSLVCFARPAVTLGALLLLLAWASPLAMAQTKSVLERSEAATAGQATYQLRYKLTPGEQLTSKVVHFAETKTRMSDVDETSSSSTTSEKVWEVEAVNGKGEMTFVYRINSVKLAQTVGDGEELRYDSQSGETPPDMFNEVAETVNKPLAKVTINSRGQIIDRDDKGNKKAPKLGMGELTIPLPAEGVAIGGQWSVPREVRVKQDNGAHKTIKVRELYTLEKVSAGVATISIVSQPLTPVREPAIEAQLIQQLSQGKIKFDMDRGRVLSKELNWSDEVVGFRGAETSLRYDAKYSETLMPNSARTASKAGASQK